MMPKDFPHEPKEIWSQFYQITQIPRPSKKEEQFRAYILNLANKYQLETKVDQVGNVVVYVPGTKGKEGNPSVIIQNHMDMVTDHAPGKEINFDVDPITTFVENGWLKADRTTLGADNGIGCAAALATITDPSLEHPPLELLFTTDEETGLNGAWGVQKDFFKSKLMLNLDTEEWGSLYIGCAGGIDYELSGSFPVESCSLNSFKLTLSGLVGGHSGVDIHLQRANAIKVLAGFLNKLEGELRLSEMRSGRAHNIIPRDGFMSFATPLSQKELLLKLNAYQDELKGYLGEEDHSFHFELTEHEASSFLSSQDSKKVLQYLTLFPHGAHSYDLEAEDTLVAISNNLATFILKAGALYTLTSLRFFDRNQVKSIEGQLSSLSSLLNLDCKKESEYPSWKPSRKSALLSYVKKVYQEEFGSEAEVKAIHAGLECGILRDKIGEVDVISFGPTIMGAHSPDERIEIDTVTHFWKLFKAVLKGL